MNYKILEFKDAKEAIRIREKVFVEEQGFENEFDDLDYQSLHLEIYDNDKPVGCARMYTLDNKVYILGRIAVLKEYRGLNYGSKLVTILEEKARELNAEKIELSAQLRASVFYEKLGYQKYGEEYFDEYCPHIKMIKMLS
ncbi:MAG: GNAT family N-acetyltransferase [Bacilli bacterium]|nr:GNAT family N-acetyltransferase [Bacilli bacterium]